MKYFKVTSPYSKIPINHLWLPIECDPSLKKELYVFVRKPIPGFREIWNHYFHNIVKSEKIGCASLFYFVYYKELLCEIENICNSAKVNRYHMKKILTLEKKELSRWMKFISNSDDTLYEQNNYFRQMSILISASKIK